MHSMCTGKLGQVWLHLLRETEDPGLGRAIEATSRTSSAPLPPTHDQQVSKPKLLTGHHPFDLAPTHVRLTQADTDASRGPRMDTPGPVTLSDPAQLLFVFCFCSSPSPSHSVFSQHKVSSNGPFLVLSLLPLYCVYWSFISTQETWLLQSC